MKKAHKIGLALATKATILTTALLTYTSHDMLKKVEYNLFENKQNIANGFYQNPPILGIEWNTNDYGKIETYLVNNETGKKVEIMYDMLPSNSTMFKGIGRRVLDNYKDTLGAPADSIESLLEGPQ